MPGNGVTKSPGRNNSLWFKVLVPVVATLSVATVTWAVAWWGGYARADDVEAVKADVKEKVEKVEKVVQKVDEKVDKLGEKLEKMNGENKEFQGRVDFALKVLLEKEKEK